MQEAAAGPGVERLGAAQRAGVEQLHPDLEAAQYAFEAIQGHGLSDLHGNVAESYPIEQHGARHCPPRRIPRHPQANFPCPGFPSSIPPSPPPSASLRYTLSTLRSPPPPTSSSPSPTPTPRPACSCA